MKLFTKYSRISIIATIGVFLLASGAFFFSLRYVLISQIDEDLKIEESEIRTFVKMHDQLPESIPVQDQMISFTPRTNSSTKRYFKSLFIADPNEGNSEHFRQLQFSVFAGGRWYTAAVSKSLEETDAIVESVILITSVTILCLLIMSFIINRVALKRLWQPFYQTLTSVRDFKVSRDQPLTLSSSQIDEFNFMNQTLERITGQAQVDYRSLKTFSENASHELQTPLAVIRSKLDLLIQDENLTEQQSIALQSTYNAIQKLTTLNQSLLLLAKIENRQFEKTVRVPMKTLIEEKVADFQEIWQSSDIQIETVLEEVNPEMNSDLADIFLNNLLSNATRHNFNGGRIEIVLNSKELIVKNTSQQPALDETRIFDRFYKPSNNHEHNGLGLSIIKQIADVSGFRLEYSFGNEVHQFEIFF